MLEVEPLELDEVEMVPTSNGLKVSGVISMRSPSETLTPYFRRIHDEAVQKGVERLLVDITELSFMNSSSIRALADWVEWIRQEPADRRYVLCFLSDPGVTWQSTTLAAVRALDEERVEIRKTAGAGV